MTKFLKWFLISFVLLLFFSISFAAIRSTNRSTYELFAKRIFFTSNGTSTGSAILDINTGWKIITYTDIQNPAWQVFVLATGTENKICLWNAWALNCNTNPSSWWAESDPIFLLNSWVYFNANSWVYYNNNQPRKYSWTILVYTWWSIALWKSPQANWNNSVAMWFQTKANWSSSTSMWLASQANWAASTAMWSNTIANWLYSLAGWDHSIASGTNAIALWNYSNALNDHAIAIGIDNTSSWYNSVSIWASNDANWSNSFALWAFSEANWSNSFALWSYALTNSTFGTAIGKYNIWYWTSLVEVWIWNSEFTRENILTIWDDWSTTFNYPINDWSGNPYITWWVVAESDPIWISESWNYIEWTAVSTWIAWWSSDTLLMSQNAISGFIASFWYITGSALSPYLLIVNSWDVYRENPAWYITWVVLSWDIISSWSLSIWNNNEILWTWDTMLLWYNTTWYWGYSFGSNNEVWNELTTIAPNMALWYSNKVNHTWTNCYFSTVVWNSNEVYWCQSNIFWYWNYSSWHQSTVLWNSNTNNWGLNYLFWVWNYTPASSYNFLIWENNTGTSYTYTLWRNLENFFWTFWVLLWTWNAPAIDSSLTVWIWLNSWDKRNWLVVRRVWGVQISNSTASCTTSMYWTIKFSWDNFYGCKTSWWTQLN